MLAIVPSATLQGIEAVPVQVEVNTNETGDLKMILVGLPDAAVKESNDRVLSALKNSGFRLPYTRTVINLAPGNLRKEGPRFDLPIALGILSAMKQIDTDKLDQYLIGGELSLSGATRPIKGALAMAMLAKKQNKAGILLPPQSAQEAALVEDLMVYSVRSLAEACHFLEGKKMLPRQEKVTQRHHDNIAQKSHTIDFSEVKGQHQMRRAVEVAVAGGHNILIIGPPGSGKSMLAQRIPTIIPNPTSTEFLEILSIHSAAGNTLGEKINTLQRPFRSPHHTISDVGLLGGGSIPTPGEISLAHNGVLFLDELPEFKRSVLEVMRQPLEEGCVSISRSAGKVTFPTAFMLVAAMNPCPCGYLGDPQNNCRCTPIQIQRYRSRISGPLIDRIDIHCEAPCVSIEALRNSAQGESSESVRKRVTAARELQQERFQSYGIYCNARMSHRLIQRYCELSSTLGTRLQQAMERLHLSARAYDRILKVARTIADLDEAENIGEHHLMEAIQYRSLDRTLH